MIHAKILSLYADKCFDYLVEHQDKQVIVSEMADILKIKYTDALDALVLLRNQSRAIQGVNGWQVIQ